MAVTADTRYCCVVIGVDVPTQTGVAELRSPHVEVHIVFIVSWDIILIFLHLFRNIKASLSSQAVGTQAVGGRGLWAVVAAVVGHGRGMHVLSAVA